MIYKIKSRKQLICLIKHCAMLQIFTNGKDVYAWNSEFTDHQHVREMLGKLDNTYNSYYIENNGRLLHCHTIKYPILKKFIQTWFPDCWYGSHIKAYDSHDGICLFDEYAPDYVSLCQAYNMRITSMAQPYYIPPKSIGNLIADFSASCQEKTLSTAQFFDNFQDIMKFVRGFEKNRNLLEDRLQKINERLKGLENVGVLQQELLSLEQDLRRNSEERSNLYQERGVSSALLLLMFSICLTNIY